jgi:hypothetical protein
VLASGAPEMAKEPVRQERTKGEPATGRLPYPTLEEILLLLCWFRRNRRPYPSVPRMYR